MNLLTKIRLAIQFIGLKAAFRTILYAIYRDYQDFRFRKSSSFGEKTAGKIRSAQEINNGIVVEFSNGISLEINALHTGGICFSWLPGKLPYSRFLEKNIKGGDKKDNKVMATRINIDSETVVASIEIETEDAFIKINSSGAVIVRAPGGDRLTQLLPPTLSGASWRFESRLELDEAVHGLGERATSLNLIGSSYSLWNSSPGGSYGRGQDPLYMTIPVFMGTNQSGTYLIFFENTHKGNVDLSNPGVVKAQFDAGALRYHIFAGEPAAVISQYTALTGRPNMPPSWSLGFHHCRWGYQSEKDLRNVLEGFEKHTLPLQALHQDIDYMDGFRVFSINKKQYPDLKGLTKHMATRNTKLITIVDPGVKIDPNYSVYAEGKSKNVFVKTRSGTQARALVWPGWCAFPDFTSRKARDWWAHLYKELIDSGIAGIWHDMNEPETFAAWGDATLPYSSQHDFDGSAGTHIEAHNIYGHLMNKAGHAALLQHRPSKRPWLLSRSGWAGTQQFAWHWTADVESSWQALKLCTPMLLNLGLSGISYSGTDIGGFSGNPDAELYTRWFQMAAFNPLFRNHAARGTEAREPWVYGEPYTSIIREFIELRLAMQPYWYTLAEESTRTGAPLMRPLFWHHPEKREFHDYDEAFLLGEHLLVAPVVEPGQTDKDIVLPPGDWYDYWSNALLSRSGRVNVRISLEKIPLFVRAGTVLPIDKGSTLELSIYLDKKGSAKGRVYFDSGDGYNPGAEIEIFAHEKDGSVDVQLSKNRAYPLPWKSINPVVVGKSSDVTISLDY